MHEYADCNSDAPEVCQQDVDTFLSNYCASSTPTTHTITTTTTQPGPTITSTSISISTPPAVTVTSISTPPVITTTRIRTIIRVSQTTMLTTITSTLNAASTVTKNSTLTSTITLSPTCTPARCNLASTTSAAKITTCNPNTTVLMVQKDQPMNSKSQIPTIALGALLGLLVVLLVVVTVGWMWTGRSTRKRGAVKTKSKHHPASQAR